MTGIALMKKRCRRDQNLVGAGPSSALLLDAANALTELSRTPSSDDESESGVSALSDNASVAGSTDSTDLLIKKHIIKSTDDHGLGSTFPEKLMEILQSEADDESVDPTISWLPSGDGFIISNPNRFTLEVLPKFFGQRTEFSSFTRKLYWWGFKKTSRGLNCDSFQHELFQRDNPKLCSKMRGKGSGRKRKSKGISLKRAQSPVGQGKGNYLPAKAVSPQGPKQMDATKILMQASSLFTGLPLQAAAQAQAAQKEAQTAHLSVQQARNFLSPQSQQQHLNLASLNALLARAYHTATATSHVPAPSKALPQSFVIHVHHHHTPKSYM